MKITLFFFCINITVLLIMIISVLVTVEINCYTKFNKKKKNLVLWIFQQIFCN